jgi:hypothetical protein
VADAIAAKFKGTYNADGEPLEYHSGIPARDLTEEEFEHLSDEHKSTLAHSSLYDLRRDAPKVAASADRRVMTEATEAVTPAEAPKAEGKR